MEYIKLKENDTVEVGDVIRTEHAFGGNRFKVHRVTKKYSFAMFNEIAEGRFPRVYGFGFSSLPRQKWNTTNYEILRHINQQTNCGAKPKP